jgi:thiamine kinase-like enzyme
LNIRRPAYSSLIPENNKWINLTDLELEILGQYLEINDSIRIQKKSTGCFDGVFGYYKYQGDKAYFIKIVSKQDHDSQNGADKISKWLSSTGVHVGVVENNYPKEVFSFNCWIYIYSYIKHNFFTRNTEEMYSIGKEVGRMHKMMQSYPHIENVIEDGRKKNRFLYRQLQNIKTNKISSLISYEAILLIKSFPYEEFNLLEDSPKMIHGDLNMGNIIFDMSKKRPIIIDFEDSISSWLNPIYDVAFIIQRFVLLNNNSLELSSSFISGYKKYYDINIQYGQLYSMLKIISIRALLVLSTLNKEEIESYEGEVEKFVNLYQKTVNSYPEIRQIEELF